MASLEWRDIREVSRFSRRHEIVLNAEKETPGLVERGEEAEAGATTDKLVPPEDMLSVVIWIDS